VNAFPGIPATILLIVLIGILEVCVILWLISRMTGWSQLARQFSCETKFDGLVWRFQTISMRRGGNYSGVVTIGANKEGLYCALLPIFNIGHRPFFVPWHEMRMQLKHHWSCGNYLEVHFPKVSGVVLRLPARLVEKIAQAVGPQLVHVAEDANPPQPNDSHPANTVTHDPKE